MLKSKWFLQLIMTVLLLVFCVGSFAENQVEPLPVDQAFMFSATASNNQTILTMWQIAPGYHLYRARFHFKLINPKNAKIGPPILPIGKRMTSPELGSYQVFEKSVVIPIPVIQGDGKKLTLAVTYQGCAEAGYCYPPMTKLITVNLAGDYMQTVYGKNAPVAQSSAAAKMTGSKPLNHVEKLLTTKNTFLFIIGFLIIGILISLTPCVLPMIPILSGIIIGQKKITHWHSFALASCYVLGMAITYALAGVLFGYLGGSVQVAWQKPWLIVLFSLVFVALALSLFGLYNIQLPAFLRNKLAHASEHQRHGTYIGALVMGIFSTLILSPCVTPALVGVLFYISKTGDMALGGIALFIMGIGMGAPLLAIGAFGPKLLPKTGHWMEATKIILGILLLGVAIWMLARILPPSVNMVLWAALAIGSAIWMGALSTVNGFWRLLGKGIGLILFIYGILLFVGATTGNDDPLAPISAQAKREVLHFIPIKTVGDVKRKLQAAETQNKYVMLDFYADWCIACKEMDHFTFSNAEVQNRLHPYVLLRADVTANDAQDKALEKFYGVVAPPTVIFFNRRHEEIKSARIIGDASAKKFLLHLDKLEKSYP